MKVYGIANCTTVKKARAWLDEHGVDYTFVDFKKAPPNEAQLRRWTRSLGWEQVLNRRGTTWRTLSSQAQARIADEGSAIAAMLAQPSLIKRPVVETGNRILIGFDADAYRGLPAAPASAKGRVRGV